MSGTSQTTRIFFDPAVKCLKMRKISLLIIDNQCPKKMWEGERGSDIYRECLLFCGNLWKLFQINNQVCIIISSEGKENKHIKKIPIKADRWENETTWAGNESYREVREAEVGMKRADANVWRGIMVTRAGNAIIFSDELYACIIKKSRQSIKAEQTYQEIKENISKCGSAETCQRKISAAHCRRGR